MSTVKTVLILGNGQLAQMTRDAGKRIGIHAECLGPDQINSATLKARYDSVDAILFESEFNDPSLFAPLQDQTKIHPSPKTMGLIQNKLRQKEIFDSLGLLQPQFQSYVPDPSRSLEAWATRTAESAPNGIVFKWAMHGYDGKGVFIQRSPTTMNALVDFCRLGVSKGAEIYAEQLISFKREFAIVTTRSLTGQFFHYPLVETIQKKGVCFYVEGPSTQLGVSLEMKQKAEEIAKRIGFSQNLVGTYAVELFEGPDSKLFVNELAPRVHNSGHFSIEASKASQFENHLRACLGLEIIEPGSQYYFLMLNLLGPESFKGTLPSEVHFDLPLRDHVYLHWYQKTESRPLRKLGHLTYTCRSRDELARARTILTDWLENDYPEQLRKKATPS